MKKKDFVKAAEYLNKSLPAARPEEHYNLHRLLVVTSVERGIPVQAEAELKAITLKYGKRPEMSRLYFQIAESFKKIGRDKDVERIWLFIADTFPGTADAHRALEESATAAFHRGNYAQAVVMLRRLFESPTAAVDEKLYIRYIDGLYRIGEFKEILTFARSSRLTNLSASSWNLIFNYLAKSYHHLSMNQELYALIAGEKEGIFDYESYYYFVTAALSVDDLYSAEKAMSLLPRGPYRLAGAFALSSWLLSRYEIARSENYAGELANQDSDVNFRDKGKLLTARIFLHRELYQDAFNLAESITNPLTAPERDAVKAQALAALGKGHEAIELIKKRLAENLRDPSWREILPWIIELMGREGDGEGLDLVTALLQQLPDAGRSVYLYQGLIYYQKGLYPQSYYYLSQSEAVSGPHSELIFWHRAEILYHFYKNDKTALTYYKKAGEKGKSPYRFRSLMFLALHAAEHGGFRDARYYLETVLSESPQGRFIRQAEILRRSDSRLSVHGTPQ